MGLTEDQINEQAAMACERLLNEPVTAACRLEQVTTDMAAGAAGVGGVTRGMMKFNRKLGRGLMPSVGKMAEGLEGGGLPDSFLLAVTSTQVAAIECKEKAGSLVAGKVLRSFPRQGLTAKLSDPRMNAPSGVPGSRRVLILYLPLDGSRSKYLAAAERNLEAMGSAGMPTKFMIAEDAASDALVKELTGGTQPTAPTLTFAPSGIQGFGAGPAVDNTAALERLAALHRSGALTDAEFAAEKAKIIGS